MNASLVVVGSGIKFMSHLTVEAKVHIEQASIVLYLVNEPLMKEWIQAANPRAESLDSLYGKYSLRLDNYRAITDYILSVLNKHEHVCVVLYGHPTVFSKPALDAVVEAKRLGFDARILPGISAEDCLFADLLIDPGKCGCLSIEATDLLIHQTKIDPTCHLIIWQISVIGQLGHPGPEHNNKKWLKLLVQHLEQYYSPLHNVMVYVAAQYPGFDPTIKCIDLASLPEIKIPRISTLYVPPINRVNYDQEMISKLEINIHDLK